MVIEKKNYIIDYDENLSYIPEVIDFLESKSDDIMSFFELDSLKRKRKIVIYSDIEQYKKHIEKNHEYKDYMCADTNDGNINILSLEEAHKTKTHANMTVDDMKSTIVHEFVHICQQDCEQERYERSIAWFWEALATNLGNPEKFSRIEIKASNEEINNFINLRSNYSTAFTIGNYLIDNYSHGEILEYVRKPSKLKLDTDKILDGAREWSYSKKK